jgi:hypothetical protein
METKLQKPMEVCHQDIIRERISKLEEWLAQVGVDCDVEQAHLEPGSRERIYWHYGYLSSLRDVLKLLDAPASAH